MAPRGPRAQAARHRGPLVQSGRRRDGDVYRQSDGSYQSFAGYGQYEITAETWGYGYDRVQTAQGATPDDALLSVRDGGAMRSFSVSREGDTIVLLAGDDRREHDEQFFTFMPGGSVLRKYRKVE